MNKFWIKKKKKKKKKKKRNNSSIEWVSNSAHPITPAYPFLNYYPTPEEVVPLQWEEGMGKQCPEVIFRKKQSV